MMMKNYAKIVDKDVRYMYEYEGILVVLDYEGYVAYKLPFQLRQVNDETKFWEWFNNDDGIHFGELADYCVAGGDLDFRLWNNQAQFNNLNEEKVKIICRYIVRGLIYPECI